MRDITFRSIGVIHSRFKQQDGTPTQAAYAGDAEGSLELDPAYAGALKDLETFERIWVLYYLDRAGPYQPLVVPYMDDARHGLFATRAPSRPNPIGISVVTLVSVKGNRVEIRGLDILDETPLLDIKPYIPEFDAIFPSRAGWFDASRTKRRTADSRFGSDE
ncbi:MAG: tRNA (N6-threonylcarbamoyladenosine(37)-N6)-methyltransferase TrmO [Anaeromyxobacter sp. RBG_16_69_14]|nr:MAG: tRNA (N6-threonylcarbamoyladenosine(37)-N6)-methyltransferase TrmO [Anaeromyxobacter sp. RBG_16_69_14]